MAGALGALAGEQAEVEKRDASDDETISAREEEFWNVVHGAVHGALGALFGELEQVEVEKRGASEDEMIKARSEAEEDWSKEEKMI